MTKRQYIHLAIVAVLFVAALIYDTLMHKDTRIEYYASKVNECLSGEEKKAEQFFLAKDYIKRQLDKNYKSDNKHLEQDIQYLQNLIKEKFTINIYQGDSLVYWTNNMVQVPVEYRNKPAPKRRFELLSLTNGYYELIQQSYRDADVGQYTISCLIPIKYQYQLESNYLKNHFVNNPEVPAELELSASESPYPIVNNQGQTLGYLQANENIIDQSRLQISLFLYLLAFIVLGFLFNTIAGQIIKRDKIWQGAAFLIISIFGIRFLSVFLNFSDKFVELPLFARNFNTVLSGSLGDLLINIVLLLWVMAFFHKEFPVRSYDHLSFQTKVSVTVLNYIAILSAILILTGVFKTLVFNTGLTFDFDNVFSLDNHSLLAVFGVILLLIALFLFSHRMMMTISRIGLTRYQRLAGLGIATAISLPILLSVDFIIDPVYLLLIAFVFILIFDQFIDRKQVNFTWLLIWLVILSAFPSVLLFRYNAFKDYQLREAYAQELANPKDLTAEHALADLQKSIADDTIFQKDLSTQGINLTEDKLRQKIDQFYTQDSYLFYNYSYDIYGFNAEQEIVFTEQRPTWDEITFQLESSSSTPNEQLKYWTNGQGKDSYFLALDFLNQVDQEGISLILEFQRQRREQSKVFTELLIDKPYKELTRLGKYDYAVYKNNKQINAEGKFYGNTLNLDELPPKGEFKEEMVNNRSELIYNSPNDNIVVVIGKETEDYLKKAISLFSFIFSMLIAFVLVFTMLNYFIKVLPDSLNFFLPPKPSLKNRVQYSVIALILVSFIFIGVVTVWFFRSSSNEYHENRLERKTSAVKNDAQHEIEILGNWLDTLNNSGAIDLSQLNLVNPLSKIHRLDVNMYDLNGQLVRSSEEELFKKGIISKKMIATAFDALHYRELSEYIEELEYIGGLSYKTAYIPLKLKEQKIAYLGLPYYSKQSELRSDVTVFMSTLMNVYVFLLLIAGGFAIFVANSITRPIAVIGEKLKQIKLGKRNEALEWHTSDEIGTLIEEYNRMISKLAESAEKLAQSEREDAWREMAKQVAHEIKNPLTPMKLSIQYLQHAYRSNPQDIEPLLKRVSSTLIEQIDNLAQIASEFSNFAKMPRAENQKINVNALVTSVYDLFSDGERMEISLNLPLEEFHVYADKNHLIRVLTNLVKNAQQAIPDGRNGKIDISLYSVQDIATIRVQDNGTGIPDDKKDKVFVPHFTTKNSGTGLGLAISKNIIESVDGDIYFKTKVDVGTEFFVELPIVEVTALEEVVD